MWLGSPAHAPTIDQVGGKGRSLHTMTQLGLQVPNAFVVTTDSYRQALTPALTAEIDRRVATLGPDTDVETVTDVSASLRELLFTETENHAADAEIRDAYTALAETMGQPHPPVAVRSSSAAEDSDEHSFAGEHDSHLWVLGADEVSEAVRRCWASLFTARAIAYRARHGTSMTGDAMAVVVQHMVDARAAGVFMTLNPVNGDPSKIVIESVWGLGEPLVSGTATPDRFVLDKVTHELLEHSIADKPSRAVRDPVTGRGIVSTAVETADREQSSLAPDERAQLLHIARTVEQHAKCAQDGEFAVDGQHIHLLQTRPETAWSTKPARRVTANATGALGHIVNTLTGDRPATSST